MVSQVNMVTSGKLWMVDVGATMHICGDRSVFTSYTPIREGEDIVYIGDSRPASILSKGKVLLKLISDKMLSLAYALHVYNI